MSFHGPHNAKGWYPFTPHAPMPNILCEYHAKTTIDSIESEHIYDIRYTFQLYSIARVLDDRISRPPGVHEISQCSCSSGIDRERQEICRGAITLKRKSTETTTFSVREIHPNHQPTGKGRESGVEGIEC